MSGKKNIGEELFGLVQHLYPICRSITGDGVRRSLRILQEKIPLEITEIPTGTRVFDWEIPQEWNIRDAWIKNSKGEKLVDFSNSNLHVLNYSIPVDRKVDLEELKKHLFTLPDQPDLIPYRTSYYQEQWGFCITHNQLISLPEDTYHVCIDSDLKDGSLTYGEFLIRGSTSDEILISCHICHPSLCNDNLSGIALAVYLAERLLKENLQQSYRFLFIPGTIGSIAWLALNEEYTQNIKQGLVLSCLGDSGNTTYKRSRKGKSEIDRVVEQVLAESGAEYEIRDFSPYGYDERQYCSPGINLPVGCFMRTPFGEFPEYHTSADNLDFIRPEALADSYEKLQSIIYIMEHNRTYLNQNPKCEPNLGKRGLYSMTGGGAGSNIDRMAILWILNLSDGMHSLLDITIRSGIEFRKIKRAADALLNADLLKEYPQNERNKSISDLSFG